MRYLIQKASGGEEISQDEEGGAESLRRGVRALKGRNETMRSVERFQTLKNAILGRVSDNAFQLLIRATCTLTMEYGEMSS